MICAACNIVIGKEDCLRCSIKSCNKNYHVLCTGGHKLSIDQNSSWICPECLCSSKKGGDNSLTPIGVSGKMQNLECTSKKKLIRHDLTESLRRNQCEELPEEIHCLRNEISELREILGHAVSIITSFENKIDNYETKLHSYEIKMATYEANFVVCSSKIEQLNSELSKLQNNIFKISDLSTISTIQPITVDSASGSETNIKFPKLINLNQPKYSEILKSPSCSQALPIVTTSQKSAKKFMMPPNEHISFNSETTDKPPISESQPWTEVKRKPRRHVPLCGTADSSVTSLKAKELQKYIHLWNMESGLEDIREYLRVLIPSGECTVEELVPKGNYKSFKIGVPFDSHDKCLSTNTWPINARIKPWVNLRRPANSKSTYVASTSANSQSFREPTKKE